MKKITLILVLLCLYSCLTTSAPHQHDYAAEDTAPVKLKIFCSANDKLFLIERLENVNDTVYIRSGIFEDPDKYYLMKASDGFYNSVKEYKIRMNDHTFHKLISTHPVELKMVKASKTETYKYDIIKDSRID
ncbi:hypothetical protein HNP38_003013 [Chryseobacterium defluvii]|uniref:NlpE-like protein n=1 Tax=Chryseobacterium defluvii TaxID=160396 RepID=A0A840KID3_9FLAO|nr:hypothetical protein [Chryseobacterium defluvii]MBB4807697.1 hypothetical protein [Chryseobacterium defluvii]